MWGKKTKFTSSSKPKSPLQPISYSKSVRTHPPSEVAPHMYMCMYITPLFLSIGLSRGFELSFLCDLVLSVWKQHGKWCPGCESYWYENRLIKSISLPFSDKLIDFFFTWQLLACGSSPAGFSFVFNTNYSKAHAHLCVSTNCLLSPGLPPSF